jgi:hypothetical protein
MSSFETEILNRQSPERQVKRAEESADEQR